MVLLQIHGGLILVLVLFITKYKRELITNTRSGVSADNTVHPALPDLSDQEVTVRDMEFQSDQQMPSDMINDDATAGST